MNPKPAAKSVRVGPNNTSGNVRVFRIRKMSSDSLGKSWSLLLATLTTVSLVPWEVQAADSASKIEEVTLSKTGPLEAFPTNAPFRLVGAVDKGKLKATAVYAIFVRYWWGPFAAGPSGDRVPHDCSEVSEALNVEKGLASSPKTSGGIDGVWPGDTNSKHYNWLSKRARIHVSVGSVDDDKFGILVNNPSFFHHGAKYCVFVYEAKKTTVDSVVNKFVGELLTVFDKCDTSPKANNTCEDSVAKKLDGLFSSTISTAKLKDDDKTKVLDTLKSTTIGGLLKAWKSANRVHLLGKEQSSTKVHLSIGGSKPIPMDKSVHAGFARVVLEIVARQGVLVRQVAGNRNSFVGFHVPDKFEVGAVTLLTVGDTEPVTQISFHDPKGKQRYLHKKGLSTLVIPGTNGNVNLEDIRQFAVGRLPSGSTYIEGDELVGRDRLVPVEDGTMSVAGLEKLITKRDTINAYHEKELYPLVQLLARVYLAKNSLPSTPLWGELKSVTNPIDEKLYTWLVQTGGFSPKTLKERVESLYDLDQQLVNLRDGVDTYNQVSESLKDVVTQDVEITRIVLPSDVTAKLSLDTDAQFSHYVTGFVGLNFSLFGDSGPTVAPYGGAHLFLWPNDVSEPMWTNRSADWRRFLGLEYGVRFQEGGFGPDGRYRGLADGKLPVMYVGGLVQVIPYTFVSVGTMFSSYRRSVLEAERSQTRVSFYIGLNLDVNLVGFVQRLVKGDTKKSTATAVVAQD